MTLDALKVAAFVAYLAAWTIVAVAALLGLVREPKAPGSVSLQGALGTFLQIGAAGILTRSIPAGPLHPEPWELLGILILSPCSAWLFVWAQATASRSEGALVTDGAYAWVRHPMYLAFLGMLLATGFAVSAHIPLLVAIAIYIMGTEIRIEVEESGLQNYSDYRQRTRWRYLPGLR